MVGSSYDKIEVYKSEAANSSEAKVKEKADKLDDLGDFNVIKNKFPDEELPKDGKILNYTIQDGKIKDIQGLRRMDFIIDKNGKLVIGKKHQMLGNADDVLAAGQLKVDGNGMIRRIDNQSGHYRPGIEESLNYPELFENIGLNLDKAWLDVNKYTINSNGIVVKSENIIHKRLR